MKYWRTMLIALALGVCGLAVWANDAIRGDTPSQAESKPPTPAPLPGPIVDGPRSELVPPTPAEPSSDHDQPMKVLELAGPPINPPIAPPVVPPPSDPLITRARAEELPPPMIDLPRPPASLPDPPPLPRAALGLPPAPPIAKESTPLPVDVPKPGPTNTPKASLPPPADLPPAPPAPEPTPPATRPTASGNYKLHVRMGGNLGPRFEVRDGDTLLLKVYCDRIDLQGTQPGAAVLPGLSAAGHVRVSGSGVNGTCDNLTIVSAKGEVMLKGNVKLTCYRGNSSSQIAGESLSFQLKGGADVPAKVHANGVSKLSVNSH